MYYVDREKMEALLQFMNSQLPYLSSLSLDDQTEKLAFERVVHIVIESILDIGNAMIDGFIMRDPGSYEDIVDILEDEKVIPTEEAEGLKELIKFRKTLVQDYTAVNHPVLLEACKQQKDVLEVFPTRIKRYLDEELGPVSAFKN